MDKKDLAKANLPDTPGVYFFKKDGAVLYIGKATSLKDRVRSYFSADLLDTRGPLIEKMREEATHVEYESTDSVLEALIREAHLIKRHQPPYNTREKSDKSFNHLVITREAYPRVFAVRERDLQTQYDPDDLLYTCGPFPEATQLKRALKIIRKIFPFKGEKDSKTRTRRTSRLNEELGLTPDTQQVSEKEYQQTIKHIQMLFEGKKKRVVRELERSMKHLAHAHEFEKAAQAKKQLFALQHIRDIALITREKQLYTQSTNGFRIESYDVAHTQETDRVGVMTVVQDGHPDKASYRKFKIKTDKKGDTHALEEILTRRFAHTEWPLPQIIVVDGGVAQERVTQKVLASHGYQIPVVAVTKNEKHQPKHIRGELNLLKEHEQDIIIANAEAHRFAVGYHRSRRRKHI